MNQPIRASKKPVKKDLLDPTSGPIDDVQLKSVQGKQGSQSPPKNSIDSRKIDIQTPGSELHRKENPEKINKISMDQTEAQP